MFAFLNEFMKILRCIFFLFLHYSADVILLATKLLLWHIYSLIYIYKRFEVAIKMEKIQMFLRPFLFEQT